MTRARRFRRFTTCALSGVALAVALVFASSARATDDDDATKDLDELVARLRNPFFAKQADRDLQIVQLMLRRKTPKADAILRDLLADTGAHPMVVEQIVVATLLDTEHRLLPEVVDRLRRESGSELDRALDVPLVAYSDAGLVQRLAEFARDTSRPSVFRVEAVELLGRTGNPEALDPLLELWGGPQKDLHDPAQRAFERILPTGAATREEAAAARAEIRNLPFSEALRRLLQRRSGHAEVGAPNGDAERDYVRLASQMLPRATLAQVIESYLGSSAAAVRAMGAKRLADFPYEAADASDGKPRAARACLAALRREDVEAVELELLGALAALAPDLRGAVGEADLTALLDRVRPSSRASNAARLATVRLVGELREAHATGPMKAAFVDLGDGDVEMRLALLDALQQSPDDLTSWLIDRLAHESHARVVRKLVVLLNRAEDPAAIKAFRDLLAKHPDQQVRWDVAKALGTLWAGRQVAAARDALMDLGLIDADPTVRRTSAAALGSAGPGADAIVARLKSVLASDVDAKVRQAAAKSVVDLDEDAAAKNLLPQLADDPEIWRLYRDRLVEDVRRRDKTPERVLAAADVLASGGSPRLAIDLLSQISAARDGMWEGDGGRVAVLERLTSLLLDAGDPERAKAAASDLVDVVPADATAARARAELLLATARCRGGRPDEMRTARRSLETLRTAETLPVERRDEAEVELGDCQLRLDDPFAASKTLAAACARGRLEPRLARKAALLLDDANRRADDERKRFLAFVEVIDGVGAADAQAAFKSAGAAAAPYLVEALDASKDDLGRIRRLLTAASIVVGKTLAQPTAGAALSEFASAIQTAKTELRAAIERAAAGGNGVR